MFDNRCTSRGVTSVGPGEEYWEIFGYNSQLDPHARALFRFRVHSSIENGSGIDAPALTTSSGSKTSWLKPKIFQLPSRFVQLEGALHAVSIYAVRDLKSL